MGIVDDYTSHVTVQSPYGESLVVDWAILEDGLWCAEHNLSGLLRVARSVLKDNGVFMLDHFFYCDCLEDEEWV